MESAWNPNRKEPKRTEPKRTEQNRTEQNRTPEADFERLWTAYPEDRRGGMQAALDAFRQEILSPEDADEAMERLKDWKQSQQWNKDGGQYIPYLNNWLFRGIWKEKPTRMTVPTGASGELGEAELEAIRRILAQDMEE